MSETQSSVAVVLDVERVYNEVCRALVQQLYPDFKRRVWEAVHAEAMAELARAVRAETQRVIAENTAIEREDGKSVRQLVLGVLNGKGDYHDRSRVVRIVESRVDELARELTREIIQPYADKLRAEVTERVVRAMLQGADE